MNGRPTTPRVLHLGKFFPPCIGGIETYLADLVAAQRAQGTEAFALVHGDALPGDPPWLVRVPVQVQLVYAPIAVGYRRALAAAIERFKPDVLHLHMPNNSVFWALCLASARALPWVVHWHADVKVSRRIDALSLAYPFYRPFEQAVLERAHRVVATSAAYLEASRPLRRWRGKACVVPLGLAAPAGAFPRPAGAAAGASHWTPGRLRVLSLGRLAHYKGFDTLISAMDGLPGAELLIAGDGELREPLERQAAARPQANVRLLGAVAEDDKQALLASCDVFALASCERTEAFGMVLLEAMAHGKPCLVSDLPGSGMTWVVGSSGGGRLVALNDAQAWRSGLRWMAEHAGDRQALGEAGRRAFHNRFTAEASAQALRPEYHRALGQPPARPRGDGGSATLIVIPARNEAATIGTLLRRLREAGYRDVVVIDDLSTDGTGDIARAEGALVVRPVLALGAWGGMQTGIRYGLRNGFRTVITMDADGQHEVDELPALLAASTAQGGTADVVIGAHPERASRLRHIAWAWFRTITGLAVTDLTSGFRCYNSRALPVLAAAQATLLDYQDVGTLLLLRDAGLTVVEVPVSMNPRLDGISRIFNSWLSVARYMIVTTLLCLSRWGPTRTDAAD